MTLPRAGGGSVRLGPGSGAHLVLFFDTWETEVTDLAQQLEALNRYQAAAKRQGLPPLVAIDEAGVEASPQALPRFLRSLPHPLSYPVAVDPSGSVADGYRVQDSPWLELVSAQRPLPLLRGPRRQGLADAEAAARAGAGRADEVKTFRRTCRTCRKLSHLTHTGDTSPALLC